MQDLVVNRHAVPEWNSCKSLVFVYPHKLKDREHLVHFYDKLLSYIPDDISITLVVKDKSFSHEYLKKCREKGITNDIDFIEIPAISDIWIRDFAPQSIFEGGLITGLQFEYQPAYVEEKYHKYLQHDHDAGELIWKHIYGYGVDSMYFKWDMGNLTHNGNGTAIITNRLIADNQGVSIEHELKPMLHVTCGFKEIVFIPTETLDATGHVGGMCRFISDKVLVVGAYPNGSPNQRFMDILAENLQNDLGEEYRIIRLLNAEPEEHQSEGIGSAVGNHLNFLRLDDIILMPYYSDEISGTSLKTFQKSMNELGLGIEVIPVDISEIQDLARLGGVLNCICWQVY